MTREQAIEFGKMWLQINEDAKDSDTYNFFKFSIEALEQEPILDKIIAEIKKSSHGKWYVGRLDGKTEEVILLDEVLQIIDKYRGESEDKE